MLVVVAEGETGVGSAESTALTVALTSQVTPSA